MLTKDRVGGALAIVAAVIGLVLVFSTHESQAGADDDDAKPGTTPSTSQVQQAPVPGPAQGPAQPGPAQPGPSAQPSPPAQPAPAPAPKKDDDGDDDD